MSLIRGWGTRLRALLRRTSVERELDEELAFHLEQEVRNNIDAGMSEEEARRRAAIAFGGVEKFREEVRDGRLLGWLSGFSLDLKLGVRMLIKYPGLTIIGVVGIAVAIAIGVGFFAFINTYVYSTLPLEEGDRIVGLENWNVEVNNEDQQSLHDFALWREEMQSVREISAFTTVYRNLSVPGGLSGRVQVAEMTASGFELARVTPVLGRPLLEEDERPGAPPVLVIGFEEWQNRFGGDPGVIGREVRLGGTSYTIVGVMPEGFGFPVSHSFWTPLRARLADYERGEGPQLFVFGRLAPGVSMEQAQAELIAIGRSAAVAYPETNAQLRPAVLPYSVPVLDIQGMGLWEVTLQQFAASLLLLVVAVNVAILVYARTATRLGEITVRSALGASRKRIVTQFFLEAVVLSGLSAAAGLLLLYVGLRQANLLIELEMDQPFWIDFGFDSDTVLYAVLLATLAAVIVGVVPALQATGPRLRSRLSELSGGAGLRMGRTWTMLIVAQVAIAAAALPIAVAVGWTQIRAAYTLPTFDASEFLLVRILMEREPPPGIDVDAYAEQVAERYASMQAEMIRLLEDEPGVSAVTFSTGSTGVDARADVQVEGGPGASLSRSASVSSGRVAIDYFDVLGLQMVGGRGFGAADLDSGAASIIVNQAFVQRVLEDGEALGRRIRFPAAGEDGETELGESYEIIGVVENLMANSIEPELTPPTVYRPIGIEGTQMVMTARLRGAPAADITARPQEIAARLDPTSWVTTSAMNEIYAQTEAGVRLVALVVGLVLLSVLLLSAGGIYSLMSFTVTRRRREIGIRTALGAHPRQIVRTIFSRAIWQLGLGIIVGLAGTFAIDRTMGGELLGGNGAFLLPIFTFLMVAVGVFAALGPTRRGLGIEPMEALRAE